MFVFGSSPSKADVMTLNSGVNSTDGFTIKA